jgi:hypothetical protein
MRFASLSHFGLSVWRIICVGVAASSAAWLLTGLAVGDALGQGKVPVEALVSVLVFYIVVSTPRRELDRQRVAQAQESVLLSAASKSILSVTGSRPRTLVHLWSREPALAETVDRAARMVLLGGRVEKAVSFASRGLASYSAATALRSLATLEPGVFDSDDEEMRGLTSSTELSRETKLPVFMTACFFTPIMLLLYAVFSRSYGPVTLAELTAFEFIVLDLVFYLTSTDRGPR